MWDERHVSDGEPLPAELEPVHQRLAQDGAVWRAQLPSGERLATGLTALLERTPRAQTGGRATGMPVEPQDVGVGESEGEDARLRFSPPPSQTRHDRRRMRGLVGVAAAVVIVGLMGALLSEVNAGRIGRPSVARATATATVSTPHAPEQWERVLELPRGQYAAIAPSDPRVIYVMDYPHIRRTDDEGRTWHDLPVPASTPPGPSDGIFDVMVSPTDPYTVFLAVDIYNGSSSLQSNADSYPPDYYSTDGGQHWDADNLPIAGTSLGIPTDGFFLPLQAQGSRLYDMISPPVSGTPTRMAWRLVTSADGGVTWQLADAPIYAGGGAVLTYLATTSGQTVFAEVVEHDRSLDLWRSDDAGVHWTKVPADQSAQFPRGVLAAVVNVNGQPMLYVGESAMPPHPGINAHPSFTLWVSADGGSTWTSASSRGLPAPNTHWSDGTYISGVLADGSVVVPFRSATSSDVTFYAWKLGQPAWRQVCPPLPDGFATVFPAGPGGPEALWGFTVARNSQHVETSSTVWRCALG